MPSPSHKSHDPDGWRWRAIAAAFQALSPDHSHLTADVIRAQCAGDLPSAYDALKMEQRRALRATRAQQEAAHE